MKNVSIFSALIGAIFTASEIMCYFILYFYLLNHNNNFAINILDSSVIRMRNLANSISLYGQILSWVMEVWYNVLIGFISNVFNPSSLREVAPFFKTFEFILVPIVQIYTSPPIKRFIASRKGTTLRSWNALLHN